jgi:hypothetical protein
MFGFYFLFLDFVIKSKLLARLQKKEAKDFLLNAIELKGKASKSVDHWLVAAYYDLASLYFQQKDYDEAYQAIRKTGEFSGYAREQIFKYRIKKATEEIKSYDVKEIETKKTGLFSYFY